jgi:hypothetical protein
MPLILRVEDYARGLDPSINHPSLLRVWLKPFDPALMKKYPVSISQNRAGFDNIAARIGLGFPSPANTKTESSAVTILNGCRNPQIRWAMYFVRWITNSTGSQQYSELTTLFQAAFLAAHKRTPGWVGRLAIEMNFKRKRRKAWVRTISK